MYNNTKTKITNILVRELLFADDSALIAHSAEEIQRIVDAFANASSKFGLKFNRKQTEVMFQPNSTMTMKEGINVALIKHCMAWHQGIYVNWLCRMNQGEF